MTEEFATRPEGDASRSVLHCRWREVGSARGAVVIVHGFGEHSGRYEHVIEALATGGYSSFSFDFLSSPAIRFAVAVPAWKRGPPSSRVLCYRL